MNQPVHSDTSTLDSNFLESSSPLPLTKENLMTLEHTLDKNDTFSNEILQRYCHEIITNNTSLLHQQHMTSSKPSYRERCQSTPPQMQKDDVVVASPKLLPFPYHNDSLFLPTAEKIQYHYHHLHSPATTSISSTSRADSSSLLPESEFLISRPHSTANIPNSPSMHSFASVNNNRPLLERRSLPIRLDYSNIVISSSGSKQQRFLSRSSSYGSLSTISSAGYDATHEKKPWLKRIFKFFNKNKYKKQQQKQSTSDDSKNEGANQVWYCQYSKNPSADFENYYYHHQYQHQRPMISAT